jgi:hypothetical protein
MSEEWVDAQLCGSAWLAWWRRGEQRLFYRYYEASSVGKLSWAPSATAWPWQSYANTRWHAMKGVAVLTVVVGWRAVASSEGSGRSARTLSSTLLPICM